MVQRWTKKEKRLSYPQFELFKSANIKLRDKKKEDKAAGVENLTSLTLFMNKA